MCTLRNLSYRLELEVPQARLLGISELDEFLGKESPSKDSDSSCWGKKKKKKKKTSQEDQVCSFFFSSCVTLSGIPKKVFFPLSIYITVESFYENIESLYVKKE